MPNFRICSLLLLLLSLSPAPFLSAIAGEKVNKSYLGKAPMYQMLQSGAKANIILFSGGPGWWGNLKSKNFLIRERESFFTKGLNLYLFPNKKKSEHRGPISPNSRV